MINSSMQKTAWPSTNHPVAQLVQATRYAATQGRSPPAYCVPQGSQLVRLVLERGLQDVSVVGKQAPVFDLFCDARSTPPRLAAVLMDASGALSYADMPVDDKVLAQFDEREDGQIIALELVAVLFGLGTFQNVLSGNYVRVWTDNRVAEGNLIRGSSKAKDLNMLVHGIWLLAAHMMTGMHIDRVPSEENISDLPSREQYELLGKLEAERVTPFLHPLAGCVQQWELIGSESMAQWPIGR